MPRGQASFPKSDHASAVKHQTEPSGFVTTPRICSSSPFLPLTLHMLCLFARYSVRDQAESSDCSNTQHLSLQAVQHASHITAHLASCQATAAAAQCTLPTPASEVMNSCSSYPYQFPYQQHKEVTKLNSLKVFGNSGVKKNKQVSTVKFSYDFWWENRIITFCTLVIPCHQK